MRKLILAVLAAALAAGCGGAVYDEQAHRAEVEAVEGPVADWPRLRDNMRALCQAPAELFAFSVSANYAAGYDVELHLRHLCPERLEEARNVGRAGR